MKRLLSTEPHDAQPAIASRLFVRLWNRAFGRYGQRGQGFGEYALLLFLVVLAAAAGLTAFSGTLSTYFGQMTAAISGIIP